MQHFHTQKDRFDEIRKVQLIKSVLFIVLAVPGGVAIVLFGPDGSRIDTTVLFMTIPIALGAWCFGVYMAIKRQKLIFESYRLTLDTDEIRREAQQMPTVRIARASIKAIIKKPDDSFIIKGNSPMNVIGIPAQIEGYENLEQLLAEIRPITVKTRPSFFNTIAGQALLGMITVGLMAAVYLSDNKMIMIASGSVIIVLLAYTFLEVQMNKNTDRRTKNISWIFLLVMASIIGMMYYRLMG